MPREAAARYLMEKKIEKLRFLAQFFGIEDEPEGTLWVRLALRLAEEHEPGMRVLEQAYLGPPRKGRKPNNAKFSVYLAIEKMRAKEQLSVEDACKKLHRLSKSHRRGSALTQTTAGSIETTYYAGKRENGDLTLTQLEKIDDMVRQFAANLPTKRLTK